MESLLIITTLAVFVMWLISCAGVAYCIYHKYYDGIILFGAFVFTLSTVALFIYEVLPILSIVTT